MQVKKINKGKRRESKEKDIQCISREIFMTFEYDVKWCATQLNEFDDILLRAKREIRCFGLQRYDSSNCFLVSVLYEFPQYKRTHIQPASQLASKVGYLFLWPGVNQTEIKCVFIWLTATKGSDERARSIHCALQWWQWWQYN